MSYFRSMIESGWIWMVAAITTAVVSGAFLIFTRHPWRWIAGFVTVVLIVLCVFVLRTPQVIVGSELPPNYQNGYWLWIGALGLILMYTAAPLVRRGWEIWFADILAEESSPPPNEGDAANAGFSDIEAAWRDVRIRLSQARVDLSRQPVFLMIAPDETWTGSLVRAAELQVFAEGPSEPDAPLHAYAVNDAILLGVSGASAFGTQDLQGGAARMELVCRKLLDERPDRPAVRGVVAVFPYDWALSEDAVRRAALIREDLTAIRRTLKVRCPVFALVPKMEELEGFVDFVRRMDAGFRQSRCGFAVPSSHEFSGNLVRDGMVWVSGWFRTWVMHMLYGNLLDQRSNNALFLLTIGVQRVRKRFRDILESAFSTHQESEPILFRGCYFLGTGAGRDQTAFAPGLLRSPRGKVLADQNLADWSIDAELDDRRYRRSAFLVALFGLLPLLLVWFQVFDLSNFAAWPSVVFVLLLVAWVIAGFLLVRRR